MKRLFLMIFAILVLSVGVGACGKDDDPAPETEQPDLPETPDQGDRPGGDTLPDTPESDNIPDNPGSNDKPDGEDDNNDQPMNDKLKITVGTMSFTVSLENNAAAKAFRARLPMTIRMSEMNGNEKYYYLPENLPTDSSNPGTIRTGDLMLYGFSCMVLFYETFQTSYSYTRLGRVDNPIGLASALGSGNVTVTFE